MKEYNNEQLIELFDGKEIEPPEMPEPGDAPMENDLFMPPFAQNAETVFNPKKPHRKRRRPKSETAYARYLHTNSPLTHTRSVSSGSGNVTETQKISAVISQGT